MKTVINTEPGLQTVIALQDGALVTGTVQDCDPIAESAKALAQAGNHGKDLRHVARVPKVFIERYLHEAGISYAEFASNPEHKRRLLMDPRIAHFRVWPGAV